MNTIRHGELMLVPLADHDMTGAKRRKNYIASHSETGHHHVLTGSAMVLEREGRDTIVALSQDTPLEHRKSNDRHDTVTVKKGIYRLLKKREYDPFAKAMREVWD